MSEARVCVVIVSHDTREDLLRCLRSLQVVRIPVEIVVVDNASGDGSREAVRAAFPAVSMVELAQNLGFAAGVNRGVRACGAADVLVLNSDAEVKPGAVEAMAALLDRRADVAVVGPRTLNQDETIQVSFGPDLTPTSEWRQRALVRGVKARRPAALREAEARAARELEPDWVSGACMLIRRSAFEALRGFDEGFFLYEEDADLCRRARAGGWRVVFTPAAEVVHRLGASMARAPERAALEYERSHLRYYRKHGPRWAYHLLRARLILDSAAKWLRGLVSSRRREAWRGAAATFRIALEG